MDTFNMIVYWTGWARQWYSRTGFNLSEEDYIHEYILFGFPGKSDNTIVANYCILYAQQYIYLENLKNKNKNKNFNVDFSMPKPINVQQMLIKKAKPVYI